MTKPLRLDLGSGPNPPDGWLGLDSLVENERVRRVDLCMGSSWPFESDSVAGLRASHFVEHVPLHSVAQVKKLGEDPLKIAAQGFRVYDPKDVVRTQDALFFVFEEAWRVARMGAAFHLIWPALQHESAFRDPTHRRFLPLGFLDYLSVAGRRRLGVEQYDVRCNWVVREPKDLMVVLTNGERAPPDWDRYWNEVIEYRATLYKHPMAEG